jgi:hypothetical protein
MPHDTLSDLFLRVLHAGLAVQAPLARARAYSAPGAWPLVREGIESVLASMNEKSHGSGSSTPSLGGAGGNTDAASTAGQIGLGLPAADAKRAEQMARRRMTRLDSTAAQQYVPDEDTDPLFDSSGRPRVMEKNDPRAVEFREQLRTW